jgi:hypothetical protein
MRRFYDAEYTRCLCGEVNINEAVEMAWEKPQDSKSVTLGPYTGRPSPHVAANTAGELCLLNGGFWVTEVPKTPCRSQSVCDNQNSVY